MGAASGSVNGFSNSDHSESKKSESREEGSAIPKESIPLVDTNEVPMMRVAIDEQVASFKEFLIEDKDAQQNASPKG